jgi:pantoate--beta-alanine ligase
MEVFKEKDAIRTQVRDWQSVGQTVGVVPTMGALHQGHHSLVRCCVAATDHTVVTIFVNPKQFGPGEDLSSYPRTTEDDLKDCEELGADAVFLPDDSAMYADDHCTSVNVSGITDGLCGSFRPEFFDGIATVVTKLFNIIPADSAFFGRKDVQQLTMIRKMVSDLDMPVRIVGCPTVRESDGLACSSRNRYMNEEERKLAPRLYQALLAGKAAFEAGERDPAAVVVSASREMLRESGLKLQYMECVNSDTMQRALYPLKGDEVLAVAAHLGATRLIDNITLDEKAEQC